MNREEHANVSIESNIHLTGDFTIKAIASTAVSLFKFSLEISVITWTLSSRCLNNGDSQVQPAAGASLLLRMNRATVF